ncbi:MAG: hypothetical protein IRZ16_13300 [Myxococcaceae bacterium]|nr:hypothetical protein [Myxococcaceae bacterium]
MRPLSSFSLIPVVVALTVLPGCKPKYPTVEEMAEQRRQKFAAILDAHRAASTAQLKALHAIAREALAAPPVTAFEPPSGPVDEALTLLRNVEVLAGADHSAKLELPRETDGLNCAVLEQALNTPGYNDDISFSLENHLKRLEALRFVALVRVRDYTPPKVVMAGQRFEGGRASGDVLVYALDSRQRVGAFPFEIFQNDHVSVRGKTEVDIQRELDSNFASDVQIKVKRAFGDFIDHKVPSTAPGVAQAQESARWENKVELAILETGLLGGVEKVEVDPAAGERPAVIVHAKYPDALRMKDGSARSEVTEAVKKVLGREAVIRIVPVDTK